MSAMGRPHKWISFYFFIYIVLQDGSCQSNTPSEENRFHSTTPEILCELSKEFSNPNSAKTQLMNTLLSVAASKGVLPELASALQPTLSLEKSQQASTTQSPPACAPKTFSYIPFAPSGYQQDGVPALNSQGQSMGPVPNSNTGRPNTIITEIIPQAIQQPTIQVMPLDGYFSAFNSGAVQPGPVSCQTYQHGKEMYSHPMTVSQPDNYPAPNPQPSQPPNNSLPTKISLGNAECTSSSHVGCQANCPIAWKYDTEKPPMNIEVKSILQDATEPKETGASKEQPILNPHSDLTSDYLSLPQILITKSKSRSGFKKLLPAIILAMLLDDHDDGCSCCEPDSNKFIPIPYPIPIPINNLIMKTSSKQQSSEDESHEDHDEDDC